MSIRPLALPRIFMRFGILAAGCLLHCAVHAAEDSVLVQVRRDAPIASGLGDRIYLVDQYAEIIRTIDLPQGSQYAQHSEDEVVFQTAEGTFLRLPAPFNGNLEPIAQPRGRESRPFTREDGLAILAVAAAVTGAASQAFPAVRAETELSTTGHASSAPSSREESQTPQTPDREISGQQTDANSSGANRVYTVVVKGDKLVCLDARTGSTQGVFSPTGRIISSPVVSGDLCTVQVETVNGTQVYTMSLPSLGIVNIVNMN